MYRHFVTPEELLLPRLELGRAAAHHLQGVMRVSEGTAVELFDGRGHLAACRVVHCGRNGLTIEHTAPTVEAPPPACRISLYPCVSKGRRMEWTLEKAVELGASQIVPVLSERSVVRLDAPGEAAAKRDRWRRIAVEAARQCGAAWVPEVAAPLPFDKALSSISAIRPLLVAALTPDARPLREILASLLAAPPPPAAAWIVGPEGDFTPEEMARLRTAGGVLCSLGTHVLRTETAALYGLAVLGAAWL